LILWIRLDNVQGALALMEIFKKESR
jgi:hypothetical protein